MTSIEFRMIEIVKDACVREHLLTRRKHTHAIAHTPRQEQEIRQALRTLEFSHFKIMFVFLNYYMYDTICVPPGLMKFK